MRKLIYLLCCIAGIITHANAQYIFTKAPNKTILSGGSTIYDTLAVSGLPGIGLNGTFGLDSISFNATYPYEYDLVISLIAPDGTFVHLNEQFGTGADFVNTCFTGHSTNFVNDAVAPFSGQYLPANWPGNVNNGHSGNGNWILQIKNNGAGTDTGVLINWGLAFDNTPSPPSFFDSSNLPIVVLNLGHQPVIKYVTTDVPGTMGIISKSTGMNHVTDPFNNFYGHINIHARGSTSQWFPALSYSVGTVDISGNDSDVSLLGMPADHSWILYEPWDDKPMMRNVLTYKLSNDMGDYAVRTHYVELVLDGDYRGVYVLMEKISRAPLRVNVQKLATTDTALPKISGGYMFSIDKGATPSNSWTSKILPCPTSGSSVIFQYLNPKPTDINTQQAKYISSYVDSFEQQLNTGNLYDTIHGYRHFIDVLSFIDQSIIQEVSRNVDGYRLSTYLSKARNSKIVDGPAWDFNIAYGNADYYNGSSTNEWQWNFPCPLSGDPYVVPFWWKQFLTDTNYMQELKCRYTLLRKNVLDTMYLDHIIDSFATVLDSAEVRHYIRWPIMGVYTWPNFYVGTSYADEVNYLKGWLHTRIRFMDSTLIDTSCHPARIALGVTSNNATNYVINIYPNPATTELYVSMEGVTYSSATITNSLGQTMMLQPLNPNTNLLDIQALPPGVYFITLKGPPGKYVSRFVKW